MCAKAAKKKSSVIKRQGIIKGNIMILIFDYFETIVHNRSMDFNRGLKVMWEKYYKERCSFEEIKAYGEEVISIKEEKNNGN